MDTSPKGDAPGIVRVLDDKTLAIPDRPGTRRADTFTNVLENPKVGLVFSVPGKSETPRFSESARSCAMRICGSRCRLTAKYRLRACGRDRRGVLSLLECLVRSNLWKPAAWPPLDGLPSRAQNMVDAAKLAMPVEAFEEIMKQDESERLFFRPSTRAHRRTTTVRVARIASVPDATQSGRMSSGLGFRWLEKLGSIHLGAITDQPLPTHPEAGLRRDG